MAKFDELQLPADWARAGCQLIRDIEPIEVLAAKAALPPIVERVVRGVGLSSRHQLDHEYQTMAAVVDRLADTGHPLVGRLQWIWCDSEAGATYDVGGQISQEDLNLLSALFVEVADGHNGIYGPCSETSDLYVDPDWGPDDGLDPMTGQS